MTTDDIGPYSNYRLTVRLALLNKPGIFAKVAALLAEEGANLGAVDIVSANAERMIRDITFDVQNESHGERVLARLQTLPEVNVLSASDRIFLLHLGGKIRVQSKVPITTRNVLSMVYTPGVGRVCQAIAKDPAKAYAFTIKSNSVAVVTDGSAVLGLGNLGAAAAMPVMEGKVMLLKELAGIDAWPICLSTQDPAEIVRIVRGIAPGFGAINLEDISAPRCFEVERELKRTLDIPVMHDDQHGTAVVLLAALANALKVVGKRMEGIRVVVNGLGAAGTACCRILLAAGVRHLIGCDKEGIILMGEAEELRACRTDLRTCMTQGRPRGTLRQALEGADVFIGLSVGNVLTRDDLERMPADRIVFAMANPDPEIDPKVGDEASRIFATGRSDFPNQINNALSFPGIFRGALDVQASEINEAMKLAAAQAIADCVPVEALSEDYIIPSVFDREVVPRVSKAVAAAARASGVARRRVRIEEDLT
ncbi:MAG: NAD-dependent malic enzyme [Nitrospirae bacterium]|nr:NAD-dependent malic enzyme [Nitrospirota bacterium]MCE7965049.1 NAD-dependent malic enzyme [Nitrospira sp. NTP2]MCK6494129.1 NAD-dependent malic enzyme [Nitrospira sp.]MEB2337702.1 NAD-dependent malic enzyme [Nitrospirales bacterium]QOJ33574.1 MAG: NAD-dependent malic enzyme [Nitrospira sp.]